MKIPLLALAAALVLTRVVRAEENRYDLLGRTLDPWVDVLAKHPKHGARAVRFSAHVEEASPAGAAAAGGRIEFAMQSPDRLLWHGALGGEEITVGRAGQRLWAAPAASVQALLERALKSASLPPLDPTFRLGPLEWPVPEKQLVFLPALFLVKDAGPGHVGETECRVLDVALPPAVENSMKAPGWRARIWVAPEGRPARLTVAHAGGHVVLRFDSIEFAPTLPESTWLPPAETETLTLDPPHFQQLLRAVTP